MPRRIYTSSDGDAWDLVRSGTEVSVHHEPNPASKDAPSTYKLVSFLSWYHRAPQATALIELIGTLAEQPDGAR